MYVLQIWGGSHDLRLLRGVIMHGYGAWQHIATDPQLDLGTTLQEEMGHPAYLQRCESRFDTLPPPSCPIASPCPACTMISERRQF